MDLPEGPESHLIPLMPLPSARATAFGKTGAFGMLSHRAPVGCLLVVLALLGLSQPGRAQTNAPPSGPAHPSQVERLNRVYGTAKSRLGKEATNDEAAWQFARACFDLADISTNDAAKEKVANEGVTACRQLLLRDPKSAAAHYYLAMNLGEVASTKSLGALSIVSEMEIEFKKARELDDKFDYAGPDRNLGMLYLQAPGWPFSVGDRVQARQHLLRAVQVAPEYPENHLNLLEAYIQWKQRDTLAKDAENLKKIWPEAKKQLTGEAWDSAWADWEKRWQAIQAELHAPPATLTPHDRR